LFKKNIKKILLNLIIYRLLNDNNLSGEIPKEFEELKNISKM